MTNPLFSFLSVCFPPFHTLLVALFIRLTPFLSSCMVFLFNLHPSNLPSQHISSPSFSLHISSYIFFSTFIFVSPVMLPIFFLHHSPFPSFEHRPSILDLSLPLLIPSLALSLSPSFSVFPATFDFPSVFFFAWVSYHPARGRCGAGSSL